MLEKLKIGDSKAGPTIVSARHRLIVGVDYGTTYSGEFSLLQHKGRS